MFLTYGRFANVATVDYIVFMRNRDECLKEFNASDAIELFVHHTDLTELVSFDTKINNCGVLICRQACCPEAVKSCEGVYVEHDVPEDICRDYIMSQVVTPRQYAMQLGYPQEELANLSAEVYMKDDMMGLIEFTDKRRTEV